TIQIITTLEDFRVPSVYWRITFELLHYQEGSTNEYCERVLLIKLLFALLQENWKLRIIMRERKKSTSYSTLMFFICFEWFIQIEPFLCYSTTLFYSPGACLYRAIIDIYVMLATSGPQPWTNMENEETFVLFFGEHEAFGTVRRFAAGIGLEHVALFLLNFLFLGLHYSGNERINGLC
ncbi:hypothetical protein ACJX0J_013639, partial [Zea mays]